MRPHRLHLRRVLISTTLAVGLVAGAVLVPSSGATAEDAAGTTGTTRTGALPDTTGPEPAGIDGPGQPTHVEGDGHAHADGHDHSDPTTKNAISRTTGDTVTAETADPTTPRQALLARTAVESQRAEPDPVLVPMSMTTPRRDVPESRFAMAGGCYGLQAPGGRWVRRDGAGFVASADRAGATPLHFRATDLGRYLLFGDRKDFVAAVDEGALPLPLPLPLPVGSSAAVASAAQPGPDADWVVRRAGADAAAYTFTLPSRDQGLAVARDGRLVLAETPAPFRMRVDSGCARFPEAQVNVTGRPHGGLSRHQEVRGYVDAHTHGMAFEFLGGQVHCGRPWHPYGVTFALVDCPDHQLADGRGAVLEDVLSGATPGTGHDPVGWPTFRDWPAPDSLTHEGTYWKWMERSWRGGLRVFVNLLVENNQLCQLYPFKRNSCDDMDSIRLQAKQMRAFERYIDAQYGGPGKGWYRIVTDPFQARKVINSGRLAVVMGIETSVVFGCTMKLDVPQCTKESIDRQLDEVHRLGVRQMELVNKFDNALSGVAGDAGETGVAVNGANFLETGSFWAMRTCPEEFGDGVEDKPQLLAAPEEAGGGRDGIFGAIFDLYAAPLAPPLYPGVPHCNARGLTELGEHTIRGLVERDMMFDPDHMSVRARQAALDLIEELGHQGVLSSHSWSTPDAYPRVYELGGIVTPYAGDSTGFVEKWKRTLTWADRRFYYGIGFGADINGLGAQGSPRGADAANPVTYPFTGINGVRIGKQRSGQRVYDINVDGVAHYGLYPDWVEDLRKLGGQAIVDDMERGAEAYLQMWERSVGVGNDACRQPRVAERVGLFRGLDRGLTVRQVLLRAGQPHARLDDTWTYCARARNGSLTRVRVDFTERDRLLRVRL